MAGKKKASDKTEDSADDAPTEETPRVYAAPRRARDQFDCPTCSVKAGENCIGIRGTLYPWPSSKVHSARQKMLTEMESADEAL
jgi:hypothetical protein